MTSWLMALVTIILFAVGAGSLAAAAHTPGMPGFGLFCVGLLCVVALMIIVALWLAGDL
jgi:hypothetical protein